MAVYNIGSFILKLAVILLTIDFQRDGVLDGISVAGLHVEPLWNVDNSDLCSISHANESKENIYWFQASLHHICGIHVISSPGYHAFLQVLDHDHNNSQDMYYLYAERVGDLTKCQNKYVVFGNAMLEITEIAALPISCPEAAVNNRSSSHCQNIKGYKNVVTCRNSIDDCRIEFPLNCSNLLNYREVFSECFNTSVLVYYPSNVTSLDLSYNCIIRLESKSFVGLHGLQVLFLHSNRLLNLPNGAFHSLHELQDLWIIGNDLITIQPAAFQGLYDLKYLRLSRNKLVTLPEDVFQDLINLEILYLKNNRLHTLPVKIFQGLKSVFNLDLSYNQLTTLEENLFQNLSSLLFLQIMYNNLATLPVALFQGLGNLEYLILSFNELSTLEVWLFNGLDSLTHLILPHNKMSKISRGLISNLQRLQFLILDHNKLVLIEYGSFHGLYNLRVLILANNQLTKLSDSLFSDIPQLGILLLSFNQLTTLGPEIFQVDTNLEVLSLKANNLSNLNPDIFKDAIKLSFLDLSDNKLTKIPHIEHLICLNFFNIRGNPLTMVDGESLYGLCENTTLYASQHEICECYIQSMVDCSASYDRSPYLTCDRLLSDRVLVVLMWVIGVNALGGNIFVLIWKKKNTKKYSMQDLFLSNLAASDSLMGFYMLIIASADIYFGDNFPMQSETWRSGVTCKVAGALSITSSEASVFFVTLISVDRFINIMFPYSTIKFGPLSGKVTAVLIWIISLALGIVPSVLAGVSFLFYDNSHVCIGLPLALNMLYSTEAFQETLVNERLNNEIVLSGYTFTTEFEGIHTGLYFSTAIFLGLNCVCYLTILGCYIGIVRAVIQSSKQSGRTRDMDEQIKMTTNVTAIVATDFFCWSPIIVMGILVQTGLVTLPPSVYAWSVTFILPINSAVNPYLYTIVELVSNYRKNKSGNTSGSTTIPLEISMQHM